MDMYRDGDDGDGADGYSDQEFEEAAKAAFPNEDWDDARLHALKELIHMCADEAIEKHEGEEGEEDDGDEGAEPSHTPKLALVFGGGKAKSKGA